MSTDPKPLTPAEALAGLAASAGKRLSLRDVADLSPEELAEVARVHAAHAALLEQGRRLAAKFGTPALETQRALEVRRREREWERRAPARAKARGVPDDHDVARFALEPTPGAGQAFDAVREFLAWRDRAAEQARVTRHKAVLVVLSPPGTGKTTAASWAVVWHRDTAAYTTAAEVAASPRTAFSDTHAQWRAWRAPDLLVVDELGLEREPGTVLALAQERYNTGRATILLGNLTGAAFFARYADPRLDSRMQQQAARGGPTLVELTCGDLRAGGAP